VNKHFSLNNSKNKDYLEIINSVLFKSLSIGFCIYAFHMWVKSFSSLSDNDIIECVLTPLGILHRENEKKNHIKIPAEKSSMGASTIRHNFSDLDFGSCFHSNS
jgi:hypothetical protein